MILRFTVLAAVLLAWVTGAAGSPIPPLGEPPLGERWFSIRMNGERTGFARSEIRKEGDGYLLTGESGVKMVVLGFSREATARERYHLDRKLTIVSAEVEEIIDGSSTRMEVRREKDGLRVVAETAGKKKGKLLKAKKPVFPLWIANLYPLLQGFAPGKSYVFQAFDPEEGRVKEVEVTALGVEPSAGGELLHLRNDLYPLVDNDVWVDRNGNTVKESVRDGLVTTEAEPAESAAKSLAEAAVSRRDMALDFSFVASPDPLAKPEKIERLSVTLYGFPDDFPLPASPRQEVRREQGSVVMTVVPALGEPVADSGKTGLEATDRVPADDAGIAATAKTILGDERDPARRVEKLTRWVAENVADTVTDSRSALEVLRTKKGNCQAHARLYLALARAAGIPSRMATGLVRYSDKGFLYHCWTESLVGGAWLTVDPTFGQAPADATHLKLVDGETVDELAVLARVIGRLKIVAIHPEYRPEAVDK